MKRDLTDVEIDAQVKFLLGVPDSGIDVTDIPEAPQANWTQATRPHLYRPLKKPVTLRLDSDVIEWFKSRSKTGGYQTEINSVLRRYAAQSGGHG